MRQSYRKRLRILASFLIFSVAASGAFALKLALFRAEISKKSAFDSRSARADAAYYAEELCGAFSLLLSSADAGTESGDLRKNIRELSDIKLYSELARSAVCDMDISRAPSVRSELCLFFEGCAVMADAAISTGNFGRNAEDIYVVARFAETIGDILACGDDIAEAVCDAPGSAELDTVFYENDIISRDVSRGFSTLALGTEDRKAAEGTLKKYFGENVVLRAAECGDDMPILLFSGKNISAAVSRDGDKLIQLLFDLNKGEKRIDEERAFEVAENIVREEISGAENMRSRMVKYEDGIYFFEFTPVSGEVLCLDETVTLGISHVSGRLCFFDALGYYRYHSVSQYLPENIIPRERIASEYGAENAMLCKLERSTGVESLCYLIPSEGDAEESVGVLIEAISGRVLNY